MLESFNSQKLLAVSSYRHIVLILLSFSTANKGVSANMLQVGSKRRRTKKEIELEKQINLFEEEKIK